ncbi:MAG: putative mannitol operon repressor [Parcubacteria group bacterium Gr01-1014_20]|nr:MAG: putative mannitol operon repressor [Parcubacteria group bacterium Gr01-1014_20]
MEDVKKQDKRSLPVYWSDFLMEEFSKETDRAAVILTVSLFENALSSLLKAYLAPINSSSDELFDGPTAPLSEFSSKIQISYRLGLISQKFAQDLHVIRKIRNEFAHNVHGSSLKEGRVKDLLTNLVCSSDIVKNERTNGNSVYPKGPRGEFLTVANIALFYLNQQVEGISTRQIREKEIEWIYFWKPEKQEKKTG